MRRSEINAAIEWSKTVLQERQFVLPPFGYYTLAEWQAKKELTQNIKALMLGWDVTDFGGGEFDTFGAVLFTLRNGKLGDESIGTPYAEKLIILKEGQRLPLHYHASKTEDIINRGGGIMAIDLYNALDTGEVDEVSPVVALMDGVEKTVQPGETLYLSPGQSITLKPFQYHRFWAKAGCGNLLLGEVSSINDDNTDNYNAEPVSRFTNIEEDATPIHPLCNEYDKILGA